MKLLLILMFCVFFILSPVFATITDEFVEKSLDKNLIIREYKPTLIIDDFAEANKNKSAPLKKVVIRESIPVIKTKRIAAAYKINEDENNIVRIKIKERISTKSKPEEGQKILFTTVDTIKINNKIYPAGTTVNGRIETISQNDIWGAPAEIILGNFSIDGIPLYGEINKTGFNNTLWVKPLAYAGGIFFGTGFFFMFLRGGHAKIKQDEIFSLHF